LDEICLDIDGKKQSVFLLKVIHENSKTIYGMVMGVLKWKKFQNGTSHAALTHCVHNRKRSFFSLVGGGDSVAAVKSI
jgi:3-phosphoglycerate kinase